MHNKCVNEGSRERGLQFEARVKQQRNNYVQYTV